MHLLSDRFSLDLRLMAILRAAHLLTIVRCALYHCALSLSLHFHQFAPISWNALGLAVLSLNA